MSNVIVPKHFIDGISEQRLADLREQGAVVPNISGIDELPLKEPQYGETILGTLTDAEAEIFAAFYHAKEHAEDLERLVSSGVLMKASVAIRDRQEDSFLLDKGIDEAEAREYFREQRRADYLKNLLYWTLGERFACHEFNIGIRSKRRVVKAGLKYGQGQQG